MGTRGTERKETQICLTVDEIMVVYLVMRRYASCEQGEFFNAEDVYSPQPASPSRRVNLAGVISRRMQINLVHLFAHQEAFMDIWFDLEEVSFVRECFQMQDGAILSSAAKIFGAISPAQVM